MLAACLRSIRREFEGELFVVDGGSGDSSERIALEEGARFWRSPEGLALQCNLGARRARGEILLFVSPKSRLTDGWYERLMRSTRSPSVAGGCLKGELASQARWLEEWRVNFRARFRKLASLEQGVFARRENFLSLGGLRLTAPTPFDLLCRELSAQGEFIFLTHPTRIAV